MSDHSSIAKTFEPKNVEEKWYSQWETNNAFAPAKGTKNESFSLLMPPPNVTGKLHMGHGLDQTCQDVLVRFKRMQGFETLWIPGTDHAGIATQAVVEKKIYKEEGKTKHDIGREDFVERIWQWRQEYGDFIIEQLKKLGVSCDWEYLRFTMDETPNLAVRKFFTMLYNEGLIYQADYIINWDPKLQSAISDAEVDHKEVKGSFYHIHYKIKDRDEVLEVATTRPETLFGDTAVAVNPNDERFAHLIGKRAIVPICQREVPIIGDEHVDMELGTGCLKVTPGHDFNDFEIGRRHELPIINILNLDGTLNSEAKEVEGLSPKKARKQTVSLLEELGQLVKVEDHIHQVGHGERSGEVVEPMVSKQWFLNTESMSQAAVASVEKEEMKFYPKSWENTYFSWLRNPKDWCISRQLWWGHRIPVYYCDSCDHQWASEDEPTQCPKCQSPSFQQDPDVLDTWFSSGLWPLSTLGWPNEEEMKEKHFDHFYPTGTLVTGFDIIFFWVARMMMMNLKITQKPPFSKVYIHGIVRDKQGRKMSKSLGNGIDPIDMIDQYGADALRFTLAAGSGYNRGLNLDPKRIEGYRNFMNKIWNAFRFIGPFLNEANDELPEREKWDTHDRWILSELNSVTKLMTDSLEDFRFDDACSAIYQFTYEKFCSWYIELSKTILYGDDPQKKVERISILKFCFKKMLALLHPISPFISEEIWSHMRSPQDSLLISTNYPEFSENLIFEREQSMMNTFIEAVTLIRNLRQSVNMKPKEEIEARFFTDDENFAKFLYDNRLSLRDLARIKAGRIKSKTIERPKRSLMGATSILEVYIPLEGVIDIDQQVQKVSKEIAKTKEELIKVEKKLNNDKFVKNAPSEIVDEVKEKAGGLLAKLKSLEVNLNQLQ